MSEATIVTGDTSVSVRLERHLDVSPSEAWSAITDREELARWFPCDVIVDGGQWVVGANITFPFSPAVIDMTLHGVVIAVDEPRLLSYSWGDDVLRFELSAEGSGTRLVVLNQLSKQHAARNAAGWDECLDRLTSTVSDDSWKARFDRYSAQFEPTLGAQEGPMREQHG